MIRMKLHQAEEPIFRHEELFPLAQHTGTRTYFHAKPYVLVPDITLTVALSPDAQPDGAIGRVTKSDLRGVRHREIGQAQAWYYPADRTLMLWECYLLDWYRQDDPTRDQALSTLWQGFERTLLQRLPTTERLVTTWEDIYPRSEWRAFLVQQGYEPHTSATFTKRVTPRTAG